MKVIQGFTPDNVLREYLINLAQDHYKTPSRNGDCLRFKTPVTTVWDNPINRISWSPLRDANPFLHFLESCWMLAGRNDVKTVGTLAKNMFNYSDDGETLNGAYGYRWRQHFGFDQISKIIEMLRRDPTTRRCVLQMWDGKDELLYVDAGGKDACCNTAIYFDPIDGQLNMTVTNRSNDQIWGAAGANIVHMSILHEYVAKQAGLKLGSYYQMSNNLHLYLDLSEVMKRVASYENGQLTPLIESTSDDHKQEALFTHFALEDAEFVRQLNVMIDSFLAGSKTSTDELQPFFLRIAGVLINGFLTYKADGANAAAVYLSAAMQDTKSYWIQNAIGWLKRRPSYVA